MKTRKSLALLFGVMIFAGFIRINKADAQQILNNSFEDWSVQNFFENPAGYNSTNYQAYLMSGQANVTKSTDSYSGSFAVKLETIGTAGDPIPGGIFLGTPGQGGIFGGVPYSGHPDTLRFHTKYNLTAGDTAILVLRLQLQGVILGMIWYTLAGIQQDYTEICLAVNWYSAELNPDTAAFVIFSSDPGQVNSPGSVVYLDDIQLTGTTQQLPNSNFENWINLSAENPDNWVTSNPFTIMGSGLSVSKSTDHIDGLYSAKITNAIGPSGDTISYITNGTIGDNGPSGGTPVTQNPSKLTFYYKYQPVNNDTALAMFILWRWDSPPGERIILDSAMTKLPAQSTWTYYEIPFNYTGTPPADTVTVAFAAGLVDESGQGIQLGSSLWVDKVQLDYGPIGFRDPESINMYLFPNPASEALYLQFTGKESVDIQIFSVEGQLIKKGQLQSGEKIEVTGLQPGCYFYKALSGSFHGSGKFVKTE